MAVPPQRSWRALVAREFTRAQQEAAVLRDWATLLFLNQAWADPAVVLEAPWEVLDDGTPELLPGIWRTRAVSSGVVPTRCRLRMWIMLAGDHSRW